MTVNDSREMVAMSRLTDKQLAGMADSSVYAALEVANRKIARAQAGLVSLVASLDGAAAGLRKARRRP